MPGARGMGRGKGGRWFAPVLLGFSHLFLSGPRAFFLNGGRKSKKGGMGEWEHERGGFGVGAAYHTWIRRFLVITLGVFYAEVRLCG